MDKVNTTRKFHIGDVLTLVGDKLISPNGITGVYDIMGFLLGQSIFTHQLVTYHEICKAEILIQHPQLSSYDDSECTLENWCEFLDKQQKQFGETLEIRPIVNVPPLDPIKDLLDMVPAEKVMVVTPKKART